MEIKSARAKREAQKIEREFRENEIVTRYMELLKEYKKSEATEIVASEFNVSIPHVYEVRRRVAKRLTPSI